MCAFFFKPHKKFENKDVWNIEDGDEFVLSVWH
jgi:hypothetical protein